MTTQMTAQTRSTLEDVADNLSRGHEGRAWKHCLRLDMTVHAHVVLARHLKADHNADAQALLRELLS